MWQSDLFNISSDELDLEAAKTALDELFFLAKHYRSSEKFMELLRFVAKFREYSAFNAMLVHIQMPGAKYVLPAKRWLKEYGRRPVPDAQPLVMLQPMSPVMFGFDVSQTEGAKLPSSFANPFETYGDIRTDEMRLTIENATRDGIDVQQKPLGSTLGGYVRNALCADHEIGVGFNKHSSKSIYIDDRDVQIVAQIVLNSNLPNATNYATLSHELGHLYCGHVGTPNPKWWPDRRGLSREICEFEAESVSYLVCRRADLETPAAEYLHYYLDKNDDIPQISLNVVFKASQRIEDMRLRCLPFRK